MVSRTGGLALAVTALTLLIAAPAHAAPPANDEVAGAITIPDGSFPAVGDTVPDITDATLTGDPPTPSCQADVSRSVWYKWTPSQTGFYKVTTAADEGSSTTVDDTVLAVYTGGPFTEVPTTADTDGCDDDSAASEAFQSTLLSKFTAGTTYYFVIWKVNTTAPDAGNTAVQPVVKTAPGPPAEDTAAGAAVLTLNQPFEVDDTHAHNDYELANPACFGAGQTTTTAPGRDSVYTFTAPSSGAFEFRVSTLNSSMQNLVVYLADSPPAGSTVACTQAFNRQNNASTYSGEVAGDVTLTAGQQIYIFVDRSGSVPEYGGRLHLEASAVGPKETEDNDGPDKASPLSCGIRGEVNPATDADFYSLGTPAAGSRIFAMADAVGAGPSADVDMRLNNATDTLEYDDQDLDVPFGLGGIAPALAGASATGVPLFLQLDGFGSAPAGISFPYYLYGVVQPPSSSAAPESEPDDTLDGAAAAVNNYFSGALAGPAPSSDTDVYAFDADAGDRVFVALDGDPARNSTPVDTKLQLLDSAGNVELSVDGSASTAAVGDGAGLDATTPTFPSEAFVWRSVSSGIHYVRVQSAAADATGVGDYLLSISRNCVIGGGGIPDPSITTTSLPDATVGTPYSAALNATRTVGGAEFSLVSGSLPAGLHLAADGHIAGTPSAAGTSSFTVQVKDGRDLTDSRALSIVTHAGPGVAGADKTAPKASRLVASNKRFAPVGAPKGRSKRGTVFRFSLSEAARVELTIARLLPGRKVRRKCVRQTRRNRHAKRCVRAVRKGALHFNGHAGSNSRAFSGKLRGRKLKPGLYQATLVARDAAGNRSKPVKVRFRVVRR